MPLQEFRLTIHVDDDSSVKLDEAQGCQLIKEQLAEVLGEPWVTDISVHVLNEEDAAILDRNGLCVIIWTPEDFASVIADEYDHFTKEEICAPPENMDILRECAETAEQKHDASIGISWDNLGCYVADQEPELYANAYLMLSSERRKVVRRYFQKQIADAIKKYGASDSTTRFRMEEWRKILDAISDIKAAGNTPAAE